MVNLFYISQDIKDSHIYLSPSRQDKGNCYLIQVPHMGKAQDLLRKLNAQILKSPLESPDLYKLITIESLDLGEVKIFSLKE